MTLPLDCVHSQRETMTDSIAATKVQEVYGLVDRPQARHRVVERFPRVECRPKRRRLGPSPLHRLSRSGVPQGPSQEAKSWCENLGACISLLTGCIDSDNSGSNVGLARTQHVKLVGLPADLLPEVAVAKQGQRISYRVGLRLWHL